jgi:protocadherin alpha
MYLIQCFLLLFLLQSISTAIERLPPISLNEQSPIGTSIYDLSRIYPSSKNSLKFSFLSDSSPHNSFFIIDSLTGRISIKRMIDREELCQTHICNCERCLLTLEIIASSQTIDILSLDITIENINDNQPTFPVSTFLIRLSENTDIGHVSSFPSATDLDYQDRIEYRIIPLDELNDQELLQTFSIVNLHTENQLGLRLLKSVDRETRNLYKMKILASDGELTGQLLLDVQILDSNDNVPKFEHDQYHIKLRENTPIGTNILHIHAFDNDEGLNALINYTIITNNPLSSFPFQINVTTGIITLIQSLDYEQETNYRFNVRARDNGPDAISVYTQIQIDVLDVNDCPPDIDFILPDADPSKIDPRKHTFYIEEEQPINTRLFHLSVSDKDSINDKIILKLLTYTNLFQLNEQYNDLYSLSIIGRLDREQQEQYRLTFEARDQGLKKFFLFNISKFPFM